MEKTRRNYRTQTYIDGNTVRKLEAAPDYRREQEEKAAGGNQTAQQTYGAEESGEVSTYGFGLCGIFICIAAGYVCGSSTVYPSAVWNYNAFKDNFCIRKPGS